MTKQVKIYVTDEEAERLKILAGLRHLTVSQHVKLAGLGVKVRPPKEIYIKQELNEEDMKVLKEIKERQKGNDFIQYDKDFNEKLIKMADRFL